MDSILDPKQEQYLNWLVVPAPHRTPRTEEAMAKLLDVNESTLRRWKKKPAFAAEWKKRVEELQGSPERTQKLLDTIYERALNGDNKAAQLYLQATGRMAPAQINVEHSTKVSEISDADLDALIASAAAGEKAARQESWQA
jgi:hypothetical protein